MSNLNLHHAVDSSGNQLGQFINIMKLRKDTLLLSIFPPPAFSFHAYIFQRPLLALLGSPPGPPPSKDEYLYWLFERASPTTTAHSNVFSQSALSKEDLSCVVVCSNRMSRTKSKSQWVTTNWWQKSLINIQLPESKKPRTVFLCVL